MIKAFIDNLFKDLKETPKVLKVKSDLINMANDKYEALINDGLSKNEAIGTVIKEFGTIDEIIEEFELEEEKINNVTVKDVTWYLIFSIVKSLLVAFGVGIAISSIGILVLFIGIDVTKVSNINYKSIGGFVFVLMIALTIVLFIISNSIKTKYDYLKESDIHLLHDTKNYVNTLKSVCSGLNLFGICMCVIICLMSFIPYVVVEGIDFRFLGEYKFSEDYIIFFAVMAMFIILAVGIGLLVFTIDLKGRIKNIASGVHNKKIVYKNEKLGAVMSVYMHTALCVSAVLTVWNYNVGIIFLIVMIIIKVIIDKVYGGKE